MLHTVNQSPYQTTDLNSCVRIAQKGDDILFYQDAVIALQTDSEILSNIEELINKGLNIYVLIEDCEIRGVDQLYDQAIKIDYAGFVKLVEKHETMYAW